MKKKTVLIVLLVVLIIGLAFFGQWYADTHSNKVGVLHSVIQHFGLGKGVELDMVYIPAGTFQMGSANVPLSFLRGRTKPNPDERPVHDVELSEFWIGKYEVTQEQYEVIMGNNLSVFKGAQNPVENITWNDAMAFCKAMTGITGTSFTLPTEAQWEYVCRAGSTTAYCFGNDKSILGEYAWYDENSGGMTHPVGLNKPNHWGLYDMQGNTFEWCRDYYHEMFYDTPAAIMKNPENTKPDNLRVIRGGSCYYEGEYCRSAVRLYAGPASRSNHFGFRVVRNIP